MSMDPEYDRVATLDHPNGHEVVPPAAPVVVELPAPIIEAPAPALEPAPVAEPITVTPIKQARKRPRWLVPAAIAAVGLIASGALGYLFYSTRTLGSTKLELTNLQTDAANKKAVADYVGMYTVDAGKVSTDYGQVVACNSYSTCRTSAQQALQDMQAFQSDRRSASVPASLSASDSQLGDSLSAGIAALQELITGMDTDNVKKVDDGFNKLNDSMLSMAKAESALGAELK